jgi:hypothetical protein
MSRSEKANLSLFLTAIKIISESAHPLRSWEIYKSIVIMGLNKTYS